MADFHMPTPQERAADERSRALYAEAEAAAEKGDLDGAVELARKALAARPAYDKFGQYYLEGRLGDLLIRADRADEARQILEASIAAGSDIPATEGMLHQIIVATDDLPAIARLARAQMDEVRSASGPWFQGASLVLGLADRSARLAQAGLIDTQPLELAEQLATESGNRDLLFAVRHERGRIAEASGDIDQAIVLYRQLIAEGSRFHETVARLLNLVEGQGHFEEALGDARGLLGQTLDDELRATLERRVTKLEKRKAPSERRPVRAPADTAVFGRQALSAGDPEVLLGMERERGLGGAFEPIDRLAARLIALRLGGHSIGKGTWQDKTVQLDLTPEERGLLDGHFSRALIEGRGAWFLPEAISVAQNVLSPRNEFGSVRADTPDAIFVWAVLDPLFDALHRPLELRQAMVGKAPAEQRAAWQGVADLFGSLGIDARLELDAMAYGGGWSRLRAEERSRVQAKLAAALVEWAPLAARRYRAIRTAELISAYYDKADVNGQALRTRVVTAGLRAPIVGYFHGDWLEFLHYIGEAPHPNEQVTTALPVTTVQIAGSERLAAAAATVGVSADQAALIGQSLWGAGESPVEARVRVLTAYWQAFDEIHARQDHGMPSLWGLVVENRSDVFQFNNGGAADYNRTLYRTLLSGELRGSIERLWGGELAPNTPASIISSASPHHLAAEALGPALKFWHSLALTAWFVCEGPYSRTSLEDAATYFARDLETLTQMGTPVDPALFSELVAVKRTLKEQPPEERNRHSVDVGGGIKFEVVLSIGPSRLAGFDRLRDVITKHRRVWTAQFLASYLRRRWEDEIRSAGTTYQRMTAEANKPPTPKVFARKVKATADRWFGGDLGALYTAIGEKRPFETARAPRLLPDDRAAFVQRFGDALRPSLRTDLPTRDAEAATWQANTALAGLAQVAVRAIQMTEVLGHRPTLVEIGQPGFEAAERVSVTDEGRYYQELALGADTEQAFAFFDEALDRALGSPDEARAPSTPAAPAMSAAATSMPPPAASRAEEAQQPKPGFIARLLGRN